MTGRPVCEPYCAQPSFRPSGGVRVDEVSSFSGGDSGLAAGLLDVAAVNSLERYALMLGIRDMSTLNST